VVGGALNFSLRCAYGATGCSELPFLHFELAIISIDIAIKLGLLTVEQAQVNTGWRECTCTGDCRSIGMRDEGFMRRDLKDYHLVRGTGSR